MKRLTQPPTSKLTDNPDLGTTSSIVKKPVITVMAAIMTATLLTACAADEDMAQSSVPAIALDIPESLTGGTSASSQAAISTRQASVNSPDQALKLAQAGTGEPCAYLGPDEDPFRNGYQTSKFMISVMASWTCIADLLIDVSAFVPHNGQIIETENDANADDFEADEPTHYSVTDESDTQVTIRMYYNYTRSQPPVTGEASDFYISWNQTAEDVIEGRMIIDAEAIDYDNHDPEDPSDMRMDFNYSASQKAVEMYLRFSDSNPYAEGFRLSLIEDLDSNPLLQVFEAKGLIEMKAQYVPVDSVPEIPDVQLYTVSDALGNGASIAEFQDASLPLVLNAGLGNHLGDYLFTKRDEYYFEYDMDWDYINKTVTSSEYRGNRTTPDSGGSFLPFDPSLDMIISTLGLDGDYFTGSKCAMIGDDCNDLLNAVFVDGFAGQEQNQGSDPLDWRSTALETAEYLTTVYPNGIDWSGAFEHSFTPGE